MEEDLNEYPFYNPDKPRNSEIRNLPHPNRDRKKAAMNYHPDPGLVDAVNIALLLNKPLLVTGEPGAGKTLLAYNIHYTLQLQDEPLVFETKSTSTARDLFYTYDSLTRFLNTPKNQSELKSSDDFDGREFITYNALGKAILYTNNKKDVKDYLPPDFGKQDYQRHRSVVLIDEIDKAPRDFPNDLLNEVEHMYFKIPELKNVRIDAQKDMSPILIITSNSEKHLPDAFLRRCIYYNIPFPSTDRLKEIVLAQIDSFKDISNPLLDETLDFFSDLRAQGSGLTKKPSTAELLEWLVVLKQHGLSATKKLSKNRDILLASLSSIIKTAEDRDKAKFLAEEWLKKNNTSRNNSEDDFLS